MSKGGKMTYYRLHIGDPPLYKGRFVKGIRDAICISQWAARILANGGSVRIDSDITKWIRWLKAQGFDPKIVEVTERKVVC